MSRRVGIELSASRCALVDLDVRGGAAPVAAPVRTFRAIPWSSANADAFVATLRLLRQSGVVPARAVVVVWGLPATYHHFSLPAGDDRRVRAQAIRELQITGRFDQADSASAVLVDRPAAGPSGIMRDVTVVCAPAGDVRARLAPLLAADFTVEAVVTPPMALASLARLLPDTYDDAARAYVAVNLDATAVAIVEKGLLLHACEIALPVRASRRDADGDAAEDFDALDFVRRLAPELKRTLLACRQQLKRDVREVVMCGDLPELRALTAPLATSLQVWVSTLEGVQGLAADTGASVEDTVRDHAAALRVAWSAASAASPEVTLLPAMAVTAATAPAFPRLLFRAAAAIVLVAALVLGGRAVSMRGGDSASSAARPQTRRVEAPAPRPATVTPAAAAPAAPSTRSAPSGRQEIASQPPVSDIGVPRPREPEPRPVPARTAHRARTANGTRAAARDAGRPAADPVVDSILYGEGRRLALIDHRVVGVGDRVDAGVIADIEPKAVVVRRPSGELRRVELKTR